MARLHALTMEGPWAWSIFHLGRNVENRSWEPPESFIGQWIAIHAGPLEGWSETVWRSVAHHAPHIRAAPEHARDTLMRNMMASVPRRVRARYVSRIVGVVRITGIRRPLAVTRFMKGWWDTARFGLELQDAVEFLQGIPADGTHAPLLWPVRGQLLDAVRDEYRRALSPPP